MTYYFFLPSALRTKIERERQPLFTPLLSYPDFSYSTLPSNFKTISGKYILEKKRKAGGPRQIWEMETRGDICLLSLLEYMLHSEYEKKGYSNFTGPQSQFTQQDRDEIEAEFARLTATPAADKVKLRELSDMETMFLSSPLSVNHDIFFDTIYETESWVAVTNSPKVNYLANYCQSIKDAVENNMGNGQLGWFSIPVANRADEYIAAYRCERTAHGDETDWILLGLHSADETPKEKFGDKIDENNPTGRCRRAYPSTILEDPDLWQEMEKDPNSNFILSDEESSIVSGEPCYPLFLSGRAGSGKSTVLQYLFAEVLLRYIKYAETDPKLAPPVYISYSEQLIDTAKRLMHSLFMQNHAYTDILRTIPRAQKGTIETILEDCSFMPFQALVLDAIRENASQDDAKFSPDKRVSFSHFKRKWSARFGNTPLKKIGAERSWHIIHTYIKGWDSNTFLTPEEYENIGRDNKTVNSAEYKKVFVDVWEKWYKPYLQENNYWDDLDAVRYCLNLPNGNNIQPRFSAIFCDEAQDFTRVEIEFILKLSVFSHREYHDSAVVSTLPFAFAGDEFQTLSPTGFRWESIRSSFTEKLAEALGIDSTSTPDPRQLQKNYRSTSPIVKLGNRLQLLRAVRFGQSSQPQETYFKRSDAPVFVLNNERAVWDKMKQEKLILIVPADEGQTIREYIESTPIKDFVEFYENNTPKDLTILNPAQAKGLDYPNVAIYGFGHTPDLKPTALARWLVAPTAPGNNDIELKYELNNAYVAVTRAKEHLYIIADSGESSMWDIATHDHADLGQQMLDRLSGTDRSRWNNDHLGIILPGSVKEITDDNTRDSAQIAKETENAAEKARDSFMMKQAASRHYERNDEKSYHRCLAKAAKMDGEFTLAAEEFIAADMWNAATEMLWAAITDANVAETLAKIARFAKHTSSPQVDLATEISTIANIVDINHALNHTLEDIADKDAAERTIRKAVASHVLSKLPSVATTITLADLQTTIKLIEPAIAECSLKISTANIHRYLEKNKAYFDIIKLKELEGNGAYDSVYYRAKIAVEKFPATIPSYPRAEWPDWHMKLYQQYAANKEVAKELPNEQHYAILASAVADQSNDLNEMRQWGAMVLARFASNSVQRENIIRGLHRLGAGIDLPLTQVFDAAHNPSANALSQFAGSVKPVVLETARLIIELAGTNHTIDDRRIKNDYSRYFNDEIKGKTSNFLTTPLLLAFGERIDRRGIHIDSVRFYEWAKNYALPDEKRLFDLLRLRSLELKDNETNTDLRRQYNVGPIDDVAPLIKARIVTVWERVYRNALTNVTAAATAATTQPAEEKPEVKVETPQIQPNIKEPEPVSADTQHLESEPINIRYSKKGKLVVESKEDPDVRVSITSEGRVSQDEMEYDAATGAITMSGKPTGISVKLEDGKFILEFPGAISMTIDQ